MKKVIYICDKCRKEFQPAEIFELLPASVDGGAVPVEVAAFLAEKHICRGCLREAFRQPRNSGNWDNHGPIAQEREKEARKRSYMTVADREEVERLYREGKTMEEISDAVMVTLAPVSRWLAKAGLNESTREGVAV